jgi:hypothetical protein
MTFYIQLYMDLDYNEDSPLWSLKYLLKFFDYCHGKVMEASLGKKAMQNVVIKKY